MSAEFSYSNRKILIVDDQRAFQIMLKSMLQNFGANQIHFAHTAEQALSVCKKTAYDLILVDYNLGSGQNGAQLLEELRATNSILPATLCFIITGENHKALVLNALEVEPDDFITKPFSQNQLNQRIKRAALKRETLLPIHIAFAEQQYQRAIDCCQQFITQNSRYKGICQSLAIEAMIHLKKYQQARKLLLSQLSKAAQTRAKATLARVEYLLGNHQRAIELSTEVIINNPFTLSAYDSLSLAFWDNGEVNKALKTIRRANELCPLSISRQQIMAELALESGNFRLAKEAFGQILKLARCSVHRGPEHLCNFIRSLIDEAQHEDDLYRKNRLLQEVGNVLFKARHEEGQDKAFDFNAFEGLSQARVLATKGEIRQAKRVLFSSNQNYIQKPKLVSNVLLTDTFLTLHSVGEYEYAMPMIEELKSRQNDIDHLAYKVANKVYQSPEFSSEIATFKELNQRGIEAHNHGDYRQAYQLFAKALRLAPGNTGVILNRIQSILKYLATSDQRSIQEFEECKIGLQSLEGIQLSPSHSDRLKALKDEFEIIVRS